MFGNPAADLLFIGEAPGEEEDKAGRPFIGRSGRLLIDLLPKSKHSRIALQNMVRCRPPNNRDPFPKELHACSIFLEEDIASLRKNLKAIVGIGRFPLRQLIDIDANITDIRGMKIPLEIAGSMVWFYPVMHPSAILRQGGNPKYSMYYPALEQDLNRFFKEVDTWNPPVITGISPASVTMCFDESQARSLLQRMKPPLGFDIETSATVKTKKEVYKPFHKDAKILTAAFSDGVTTIAFPVGHPEAPNEWGLKLVKETCETHEWIAHKADYELSWLWWLFGWDWQFAPFIDTMAAGRVVQERESLQSLAAMSRIHLGVNVKKLTKIDPTQLARYPLKEVLPYNGIDALASALLWQKFKLGLRYPSKRAQYDRLISTTKSCTAMHLHGLPVDVDATKELQRDLRSKIYDITVSARKTAEVRVYEQKYGEFNIASSEHVARALAIAGIPLPKTEKGASSTDDAVLAKIDNELAKHVREYREHTKLQSTYIDPILNDHIQPDGMLHPDYTVTFTATLRLSSEGPNIQNFPSRAHKEVRRVIPARLPWIGWGNKTLPAIYKILLVKFDYGQLEARVLAMASGDKNLRKAFIEKYDIHADWRDRVLAVYPSYMDRIKETSGETEDKKLLKAARTAIKSDFVFASFYGASAKTCAGRTGMPIEIMEELQRRLWTMFPDVKIWIEDRRTEYRKTASVSTLSGLRRVGILGGNEPINTPIQASAAAIVLAAQNAITELAFERKDLYLLPRLNLHDDLTFLLPDDERFEGYVNTLIDELVKPRFDWIKVPLMVEGAIGLNWADVEPFGEWVGDYYNEAGRLTSA